MIYRTLSFKYKGQTMYSSKFDPRTGVLVRSVFVPQRRHSYSSDERFPWDQDDDFRTRYGWRNEVWSPVPETVDVSITDRCNFGCTYCYQDSKPKRDHAPTELVEKMLTGFDEMPYQIAIGGGEPTLHPDLPAILRRARQLGTVPNYTTAGDQLRDDVVEATNEVCGGVAMTFHAFKGVEWFERHYTELRNRLKVQVNVHLIADKNAATTLRQLIDVQRRVGTINLVLLAYYPDVGRASMENLITKRVYMRELPAALKDALAAKMMVAFSEGLLPYFLSRPEIGVDTKFAMRSEGRFSCYVDPKGRMTPSSFQPAWKDDADTVYTKRSQELWDKMRVWHEPNGNECYNCQHRSKCATPTDFHYLTCAFAKHNAIPLKEIKEAETSDAFDVLTTDKIVGD